MMDTKNVLAVDENGRILNPNLYFFSWASLIATVTLFVGYGQQVNAPIMASGTILNAGYWAGVCVASLVALVSSVHVFVNRNTLQGEEFVCQNQDADSESGFCERLKFSIALGATSLCVTGACYILSSKVSTVANASASFVILFAWTFGVAFVTFGDNSPGNDVGNLYFSCWAAFVLSLFMVSTNMKNFLAEREASSLMEEREKKAVILSDPSSDTEKAEKPQCKADDEVETTSPSEGPTTPTSIAIVKDDQSGLDTPSDEVADPSAPISNVDIQTPEV